MATITKAKLMAMRAAASKGKGKSKYGNVRSGGYDSRKEHRRAAELRMWQRAGLISNLREQVSFELIPAQYGTLGNDFKGNDVEVLLERSCRYVADFVYTDVPTGKTVVEDTKGVRTDVYKIKRKLMLWRYGIQIREL